MKKIFALILTLCLMLPLLAQAESAPIKVEIGLSGTAFSGPEEVTVVIAVTNVSGADMPGPLALYNPDGRLINDFGTPTLTVGESRSWSGSWTVTEEQIENGKVYFAVQYSCLLDDGSLGRKTQSFYCPIERINKTIPAESPYGYDPAEVRKGLNIRRSELAQEADAMQQYLDYMAQAIAEAQVQLEGFKAQQAELEEPNANLQYNIDYLTMAIPQVQSQLEGLKAEKAELDASIAAVDKVLTLLPADLLTGKHYVQMDIAGYGVITLELDADAAPITVSNFVKLVSEGFYDGLTFHRIISGFMIQGGDPLGNGTGGSATNIKGEFAQNGIENAIAHERGVISMARSSAYDSASSQFFIMHQKATHLDGSYAAFGHVLTGMEVVDAICDATPITDANGSVAKENQPVITSVKIIEKPAEAQ